MPFKGVSEIVPLERRYRLQKVLFLAIFVPLQRHYVRTYIKQEVKGKILSLKVDSSKKDGRPFFGVNIQFSKDGEIELRTLAVRELHVSQSAHNLKEEIMNILDLYEINIGNLVSFTSDNGSNMLRAADLLRTEQEEQQNVIDEDQEDIDMTPGIKCAAHTLQLAIMDDSIKTEREVVNLFSQCRNVVKALRTETYRKKLKKAHLSVPVLDQETRWNTSYAMLESLHNVKNFIEDEECVSDFDDDTWNNIKSVLESLEPTMVATKIFQGEQLTLGDMFGCWLECKVKLRNVGSPLATKIVEAMKKREREKGGLDKVPPLFDHPGFAAAIFLDPRYFSILEESEMMMKMTQSMLRERDSLRNLSCSSSNIDLTSQMNSYFRETPRIKDRKTSIPKWWEERKIKYPELYEVAKVVHAIPATQVSVERLFSALSFVMHYLRSNLTGQMIEDLVLILNNSHLVKEDILVLIEKDSPECDSDEEENSGSISSVNVSSGSNSSTFLSSKYT
ncbi:LOW QUALITY PROTEIN: Zinc finger BED domain-containing protein 4, partial [Frankliniella fusca]